MVRTKVCKECKRLLDVSEFYPSKNNSDGLRGICKVCSKAKAHEWKRDHRERTNEIGRLSNARNSARVATVKRKYKEEHREQTRVGKVVARAVKNGYIMKPHKCSSCGEPCSPEAHHKDYSKPFEIKWLCRKCHKAAHRKEED